MARRADAPPASVAEWLDRLGLPQYVDAFTQHAITWDLLRDLTSHDLREIGVSILGHRKRMLNAIAFLQSAEHELESSPLSPAATTSKGERRQLTVMFCDLVNSVALSLRFDPEDLNDIISRYQSSCEAVVRQFGGYVAAFTGDGLKAYFGYPRASEHDPERAARAGLALVQAVRRLEPRPGLALSARVGIATGDVVVGGMIGTAEARERIVAGETPNLAMRLEALSEPDAVVISDLTKELIGSLFEYADLGLHRLKGFPQPLRAWRVLREGPAESRFEATRNETNLTPLVARDEELAMLRRCWLHVLAGNGQAVLLSGEAGVGKSRLTLAFRQTLAGQAFETFRFYGSPYHQNSSLYPIITQVQNAARISPDDLPGVKLDKLENWLSRSDTEVPRGVPLLASLLSIPTEGRYPQLGLTPRQQKQRTMEALELHFSALAVKTPVLMIFEDLHWVDPSTREFLDRVIKLLAKFRILLVMTYRPEFAPGWDNYGHVKSLALDRLSRRDSGLLVDALVPHSSLPRPAVEQILDHSDGVPLYLEELTKAALEAEQERVSADHHSRTASTSVIPRTLNASLVARLDRLAAWKEVAQIAAVIGRTFSHKLLAALFPHDPNLLEDALQGLIRGDLIVGRDEPPEAVYTFKHALLQDAASGSLLRSERSAIHERIARVIEKEFPEVVETEPEMLALHYAGAGLADPAIGYRQKAAERALQRSANAEAVEHLRQGIALLDGLFASEDRDRREQDLQTRLGATLTTIKGFAAPDVAAAYARARTLCPESQDAAQRFSVLRGLWVYDLVRADWHSANGLAEEMLSLAQRQRDIGYELEGRRALGITMIWRGELSPGCGHLEQGYRIYDPSQHRAHAFRYGNDPGVACLVHQAFALWLLGFPDRALKMCRDAITLARRIAHPFSLAQALLYCTFIHQFRREAHLIRHLAEEVKVLAVEHGFPFWLAEANIMGGWARAAQGDRRTGLAELQGGVDAFLATGARMDKPRWMTLLAEAYQSEDQVDKGLDAVSEALTVVEQTGECVFEARLRHLKGEFLLKHEDSSATERAQICFEEALAVARRQRAKGWELRAATSLSRLLQAQGHQHEAYDLLAPVCNSFDEGLETLDLKEARALLDDLARAKPREDARSRSAERRLRSRLLHS